MNNKRKFTIKENIYGYYSICEIIDNEPTNCYDTSWHELNFFKTYDEAYFYLQGVLVGIL